MDEQGEKIGLKYKKNPSREQCSFWCITMRVDPSIQSYIHFVALHLI